MRRIAVRWIVMLGCTRANLQAATDNYFKWSPGEDWGVIPAGQRDDRARRFIVDEPFVSG